MLARPLGDTTTLLLIAVTATLIMCYVNLLGVRENGKAFAVPTYLFSASVGLMIIAGLYREAFGGGLPHATWHAGTVAVGHHPSGLLTFGAIYILGRAFANGGSSLTGIEAVSTRSARWARPRAATPVLVLVDDFDLAAIAALRYARSLHPTALRAVHFVTDQPRADHLLQQWLRADRGIPLDLVDCPHRRIERAAGELAAKEACLPGTHVTVLLPRRSTRPLLGRLLHDRTADKIAGVVSRIPRSAAMIILFDVTARVEVLHEPQASPNGKAKPGLAHAAVRDHDRPAGPPGVVPISSLTTYRRATVAGRVHSIEIRPVERNFVLACTVADTSGELTALFYGRTHITGLEPGSNVRLRGPVGVSNTGPVMINPAYELLH